MPNLRDSDAEHHGKVSSMHSNLWGELLDCDENYAHSYLKWCISQLKHNKNNIKHFQLKNDLKMAQRTNNKEEEQEILNQIRYVKPKGFPYNIKRGDIVLVKFGINLADEICDLQKDQTMKEDHGHYSIIIAQKGFMFLVVPLSSQAQPNPQNPNLVMTIEGLGIGNSNQTHVIFNQIQSVSIRRISKIKSLLPEGKMSLPPEILEELEGKLSEYMGIEDKNSSSILENSI